MKKNGIGLLFVLALILTPFVFSSGASLTVDVQNSVFSPTAKTKEGIIFLPKLTGAKAINVWLLSIMNSDGEVVKRFNSSNALPEQILWDGLSGSLDELPDGKYSYQLFVDLGKEKLFVNGSSITLDTVPPFLSVRPATDIYFLGPDGNLNDDINIYLTCSDDEGIDYSKCSITIFNRKKIPIKTISFSNSIPEYVAWNGDDDIYGVTVPPGNYVIVFSVFDSAGNRARMAAMVSIVKKPVSVKE